jgi:hypothetical protein
MTVTVVLPHLTGPEIAAITTKCLDGLYDNSSRNIGQVVGFSSCAAPILFMRSEGRVRPRGARKP